MQLALKKAQLAVQEASILDSYKHQKTYHTFHCSKR